MPVLSDIPTDTDIPDLVTVLLDEDSKVFEGNHFLASDERARIIEKMNGGQWDWTYMVSSVVGGYEDGRTSTQNARYALGLDEFRLTPIVGKFLSEDSRQLWIYGRRTDLHKWADATGYVYEEQD